MNTHSLTISKIEYIIFMKNKDEDCIIAGGSHAEIQNDFLIIYMKKSIKYWSVFLLLITSLIISIPVYAQSTDPYQAIIDKLNEEYSMDMYFMEEDDPLFTEGILSSSRMRITMTPEEFEADLRQCIIENNRAKAEADRKMAELRTENIIETGSGSCSNSYSVSPRVVKRSEQSKKISGATAHLVANVKNDTGYWKFSELIRLYTSYTKGVDSTPGFSATRYQYNIIDAGRTYAFNLYGRTFTSSGVIIDQNAYRYVDFWAGKNM